MSRSHK